MGERCCRAGPAPSLINLTPLTHHATAKIPPTVSPRSPRLRCLVMEAVKALCGASKGLLLAVGLVGLQMRRQRV